MENISGRFGQHVEPAILGHLWHQRFASALAPEATLQTDGASFRISYSNSWDVGNLKETFEREVHRVDPKCKVHWS
jgi:hypothetical protein